jgi:hypothetical protein
MTVAVKQGESPMTKEAVRWTVLVTANALAWCVVAMWQNSSAAPAGGQLPFANAVEQRGEMIRELQEIKAQLKEQNALLRSGAVKVTIVEGK